MDKQIEEMRNDIPKDLEIDGKDINIICEILTEQGYRKQVEAEWVDVYGNKYANHRYQCSNCKNDALLKTEMDVLLNVKTVQALTPYCPYCNAKMKGAE